MKELARMKKDHAVSEERIKRLKRQLGISDKLRPRDKQDPRVHHKEIHSKIEFHKTVMILIYAIAGMLVGGLALSIIGTLWGVFDIKYREWKRGEPYYYIPPSYFGFISGAVGAIAGLIVGAMLGFIG